jgi:glycosyltransferase involved in cell wall biosynthesis
VRPLISIIVPVYNEARTVASVVDRLLHVELPGDRQIVVVNDGSTDATNAVLTRLEGTTPCLQIVHASRNGGKGSAIRLGLAHVRGSIVAIQDADLELDPAEMAALIGPLLENEARVVYGSRFLSGESRAPWLTVTANRTLTALTNLLYGSHLTDMETCYKVMRAEVARSLELESSGFDIEPEITAKLLRGGHKILELPVAFNARARSAGKKIRWRDGFRAVRVLLKYRYEALRS